MCNTKKHLMITKQHIKMKDSIFWKFSFAFKRKSDILNLFLEKFNLTNQISNIYRTWNMQLKSVFFIVVVFI